MGVLLFAGAMFAFPFFFTSSHNEKSRGHYLSKEPLPRQAVIRGAYLNSGTRDVGYDDTYFAKHGHVVANIHSLHHGSGRPPAASPPSAPAAAAPGPSTS